MKKLIVLTVVCAVFILQVKSVYAEEKNKSSALKNARELSRIFKVKETLKTIIAHHELQINNYAKALTENISKKYPGLDQEYINKVNAAHDAYIKEVTSNIPAEEIAEQWVRFYADSFTEKELETIIEFYNSDTGRKLIKESKEMNTLLAKLFASYMSSSNASARARYNLKLAEIFDEYDRVKYSKMPKNLDLDQQRVIDTKINKIKKDFGVNIHCGYIPIRPTRVKNENAPLPAKGSRKDFTKYKRNDFSVSGEDIINTIPAIIDFLACYPKELLTKHIPDIALIQGCPDSSGIINSGLSIHEKNVIAIQAGNRTYLSSLKTLHHELAHILINKYGNPFKQKAAAEKLKKQYLKDDDKLKELNEALFAHGFLTNYALKSPAEDFCVFASYYWVKNNQINAIAAKHKQIAVKLHQVENFYKKILNGHSNK